MRKKVQDINESLHTKFGDNLRLALIENGTILDEAEIKSRAIFYLGEILSKNKTISDTQKEITNIYNEIFTDLTIVTYLSCCAIDNSARIILRRILELGLASVYLWDLPFKYWNWVKYDEHNNDLNFKEMLDYLNDKGYIDFVNMENGTDIQSLISKNSTNAVYRDLSNVIHGKSNTFESLDKTCFTYQKNDLIKMAKLTILIENLLLSLWNARFPELFKKMEQEFKAITQYTHE